ncbi:heme exporter protein CcmD [Pseudaestuariivita rosea]|uniref:heme exporter protein CcmD n=1 Tax=Pseudaestuariivita rosea TaxID=2763263 RepID=UPI001ABAD15E|nr:heme exporter protein CcmD [Pseudaestuariivita rosea]
MMPDLGRYATEVISAYVVSIVIILAIVALTLWQARKTKARLEEVEKRSVRRG